MALVGVWIAWIPNSWGRRQCLKPKQPSRREPQPLPEGDYIVILEPYAVADIIEQLAACGMGALAVQEGRSWMNGRLGNPPLATALHLGRWL